MAGKANFIAGAVRRPGALTAAVGGKPSSNLARVRELAASGSPLEKRQANFYLNVLKKAGGKKKARKAAPPDELDTAKAYVAKKGAAA